MSADGKHYQTLGVTGAADDEAIRDAYRRLARVHHPDVPGGSPTAMARLNEAYRVLGDPARRAVYDASLRTTATTTVGSAAGRGDATSMPRPAVRMVPRPAVSTGPVVFPWRLCLVLAGLGAAVVLGIAAAAGNAPQRPIDYELEPGSCVVLIETDRSAGEVACDESARYRVHSMVAFGAACPSGTEGYRDRTGPGTVCVERFDPADE